MHSKSVVFIVTCFENEDLDDSQTMTDEHFIQNLMNNMIEEATEENFDSPSNSFNIEISLLSPTVMRNSLRSRFCIEDELENPFLHEEGCPYAWSPPQVPSFCDAELSGNAIPCSCIGEISKSLTSEEGDNKTSVSNVQNLEEKKSTDAGCFCDNQDCFCRAVVNERFGCRCGSTTQADISNHPNTRPITSGYSEPKLASVPLTSTKIETNLGDREIIENDSSTSDLISLEERVIKCESLTTTISLSSQSEEPITKVTHVPPLPIYSRANPGVSRERLHKILVELGEEHLEEEKNKNPDEETSNTKEHMKELISGLCNKIIPNEEDNEVHEETFPKSDLASQVTPFIIHVSDEESSFSEFDESDNEIENILKELLEEEKYSNNISSRSKFYIKKSNNQCIIPNEYRKLTEENEDEEENETILKIIEPEYECSNNEASEYEEHLLENLVDPFPELTPNRKEGIYWSSVGLIRDFRSLSNGLDLLPESNNPNMNISIGDVGITDLRITEEEETKELTHSKEDLKIKKNKKIEDHFENSSVKSKKKTFKLWNRFLNIFKIKH